MKLTVIEPRNKNTMQFNQVAVGNTFIFDNIHYLKTRRADESYNAFNISDNVTRTVYASDVVERTSAEIRITREPTT